MMKIANAPCSWGVLEFELEGEALGYSHVLDEMQATGYAGTELGDWGFLPTDAAELKFQIQARNLELLGAFVPVDFADRDAHTTGLETALRISRLLAEVSYAPFIILADENGKNPVRTLNAGRIQPAHRLDKQQWSVFAAGVEHIAQVVLDETGVRCVFHHHCAGFVETPWEVDMLLSLTDPNLVGLCLDTGHYTFGGGDPVNAIRAYGQRIWHVHFKDHDPQIAERSRRLQWNYFESIQQGIFCELGRGSVDFPAVKRALVAAQYSGWIVVEQDVLPGMGSPKESARRNRAYLHELGL